MAADVQLLGIGDLKKSFAKLSNDMIKKTSLRMVATAGGVLRTEAKRLAMGHGLKRTGALVRNIAIKRERQAPAGVAQYNLGVRHGRELGRKAKRFLQLNKRTGRIVIRRENDPFYWRFHEFGTKHLDAKPYIQQSLKNKQAEALAAMEKRLQRDLERAGK